MSIQPVARAISDADLPFLGALLARAGLEVSAASLRYRITAGRSGAIRTDGSAVCWALDGGALHLYDLVGCTSEFAALIEFADAIGRDAFAAVVTIVMPSDDPFLALIEELRFRRDETETDVLRNKPVSLVRLVREVA